MEFLIDIVVDWVDDLANKHIVKNESLPNWVKTLFIGLILAIPVVISAMITIHGCFNASWPAVVFGAILFLIFAWVAVRTLCKRHKEDWK